ncbi:MAG TPA: serine/threonine-protein kinase [Longimicrobiales bacterium]|nr:serine/threonine-protein kinase [Longimicrobiales bacterium]
MSTPDDPDKKRPSQPTVAWNPDDVPQSPQPTVSWSADELSRMAAEEGAAEQAKTQDDPLVGTLLRNKWRVLQRLGAGSFGTVYKVQDVKGGWIEALKILGVDRMTGAEAEEMRKRFLREAQIMKRLGTDSHHIVGLATYEEDIESGLVYFLMEFVEGRSLARVVEEEGPLQPERVIRLAHQVCDALMAAHEGPEPVVHRDLKLENLMLTRDRSGEEMIKVLDFGIAKIAEREADSRLTTVGTLGTPGYAAPEQLRAENVDGRTDLFAFGVILYALLTGKDPWLGKLAYEPTDQIYELMAATDRAHMIPFAKTGVTVPAGLANVVLRLLQREPERRFQSARELSETLERLAADPGAGVAGPDARAATRTGAAPAPARAAARPAPRQRRTGRLVASALVAVLLAGFAYYLQPWGRTMDLAALRASVAEGTVTRTWVDDGGVGGYVAIGPLVSPFVVGVGETQLLDVVDELREGGLYVDTSWEARRLLELAAAAQTGARYYGLDGGDVRTYAQRLAALQPGSAEAESLLLKVGERMAWDAEVALEEGPEGRAAELVQECLQLVPDHPRCLAVSTDS